jgi:hypothetical protein
MALIVTDLRSLLDKIREESKKERITKREASHRLAKGFMDLLVGEGLRILETGTGNANFSV